MSKRLFLGVSLLLTALGTNAQTTREQLLQNSRQWVVTKADKQVDRHIVTSQQSLMLHIADGKLELKNEVFDFSDIKSLRTAAVTHFSLDEDSTAFKADYGVNFGLLALRRSLVVGKWNTLTLPVELTGRQVLETFGESAAVAQFDKVTEEGVVELSAIDLDTDDVVMSVGKQYLIRPSKEPDVLSGSTTAQTYGKAKVDGPVWLLAGVSMKQGLSSSSNTALRSSEDNVRLSVAGSYYSRNVSGTAARPAFALDETSLFAPYTESFTTKGFTAWAVLSRNKNDVPIRFYINGVNEDITTDIVALPASLRNSSEDTVFDLQGRKLNSLPTTPRRSGIYIVNGRKQVVR